MYKQKLHSKFPRPHQGSFSSSTPIPRLFLLSGSFFLSPGSFPSGVSSLSYIISYGALLPRDSPPLCIYRAPTIGGIGARRYEKSLFVGSRATLPRGLGLLQLFSRSGRKYKNAPETSITRGRDRKNKTAARFSSHFPDRS